ncbi:MAG: NUDIX hydrolase [Anaerolineales bacterium]
MGAPNLITRLEQHLQRHEPKTRTEWEAIPAAVLVPFYQENDRWHLLFTRRTDTVNSHQGQVSFPGGAIENQDSNPKEAALREAREEIGLPLERTNVIGQMDPLLTVTQFHVTPIVAEIPWPFELNLSVIEVAHAFGVPLDWLLDPANVRSEMRESAMIGKPVEVHYFEPFDGEQIWGVTARITLDLLELIRPLYQ